MNKRIKKKKAHASILWGDGSRKDFITRRESDILSSHFYKEKGDYLIEIKTRNL